MERDDVGYFRCCKESIACCKEIGQEISSIKCGNCIKNTFTLQNARGKLPITKWLPTYRLRHLQGDLIAGLTVGLTVIPQGIAYASVAELPPQYGLYSAFMGCFIYCFMGTAKDITLGPTAIMSLMTAEFGHGDPAIAILLSFTSGIIQMLMGIFHIGILVDFISFPVISSFTTSAAITIASGQLKKWFGVKVESRHFFEQLHDTFAHIKETNIWDFVMGLSVMIILKLMKKLKEIPWKNDANTKLPMKILQKTLWLIGTARNAIVVVGSSAIAYILIENDMEVLTITGNITSGLPPFEAPKFQFEDGNTTTTTVEIFKHIGSGIFIVPIICLVETIAIGQAFARKNNYKIDANQELLAIGLSNIMGSFVSAYPVTGSFSRTAINSQSGVMTPAGGIFTGGLVLLALAFLTHLFYYIPNAALAGVIIVSVLDMAEFKVIRHLWLVKKTDLVPWFTTFVISFVLGIEYGIMVGVGVSLCMILFAAARPKVKVTKEETSPIVKGPETMQKEVAILQLDQGLRFSAVEYVKSKVYDVAEADIIPKSVILDCSHVATFDYTTVQGVKQLCDAFKIRNIAFVVSNLMPGVAEVLERGGISNLLVADNNEEAIRIIYEETDVAEDNPRQSLLKDATDLEAAAPMMGSDQRNRSRDSLNNHDVTIHVPNDH